MPAVAINSTSAPDALRLVICVSTVGSLLELDCAATSVTLEPLIAAFVKAGAILPHRSG